MVSKRDQSKEASQAGGEKRQGCFPKVSEEQGQLIGLSEVLLALTFHTLRPPGVGPSLAESTSPTNAGRHSVHPPRNV